MSEMGGCTKKKVKPAQSKKQMAKAKAAEPKSEVISPKSQSKPIDPLHDDGPQQRTRPHRQHQSHARDTGSPRRPNLHCYHLLRLRKGRFPRPRREGSTRLLRLLRGGIQLHCLQGIHSHAERGGARVDGSNE